MFTISVSVPHLQKEYDVEIPEHSTVEELYEALTEELESESKQLGKSVFKLYSRDLSKNIYPSFTHETLESIGIRNKHRILIQVDMDPGANILP
ncbi:MAG: hypothetical protein AAF587_20335 [Bacteroidota bacterium]